MSASIGRLEAPLGYWIIQLKVKKILRKYGYPLDKQVKATQTVFEQAELLATDWVAIERPRRNPATQAESGPKKRKRQV
jgi:hypothetical protein